MISILWSLSCGQGTPYFGHELLWEKRQQQQQQQQQQEQQQQQCNPWDRVSIGLKLQHFVGQSRMLELSSTEEELSKKSRCYSYLFIAPRLFMQLWGSFSAWDGSRGTVPFFLFFSAGKVYNWGGCSTKEAPNIVCFLHKVRSVKEYYICFRPQVFLSEGGASYLAEEAPQYYSTFFFHIFFRWRGAAVTGTFFMPKMRLTEGILLIRESTHYCVLFAQYFRWFRDSVPFFWAIFVFFYGRSTVGS